MKAHYFCACAGLALITTISLAERGSPIFQRLTVDEGLSQGFVTAIAQDRQGFLWFGTQDGLNRYDGYTFTTYYHSPRDETTLSDNRISSLAVDPAGTVWVGTAAGLNGYYPRTNSFVRFRHRVNDPNSMASDTVSSLYCDREGILWISAPTGLDRFDPRNRSFTHYRHDPQDGNSLPGGIPGMVREDRHGNLVIATSRGLALFKSDRFLKIHLATPTRVIADYAALCLGPVHNDRVFAATNLGVVEVDLDQVTSPAGASSTVQARVALVEIEAAEDIRSIEQENETSTWFGTLRGALVLDRTTQAVITSPVVPHDSRAIGGSVNCMLRDASGNLWLGTNGAGVAKLDRSRERFAYITPSPMYFQSRSVRAIYKDDQGRVWIGGYGGLDRFDRRDGTFRTFTITATGRIYRAAVHFIYQDPALPSILWIGTEGRGLYTYDGSRDRFSPYRVVADDPGFDASTFFVTAIYRDKAKVLWVGARAGLWKLDAASGKLRRFPLGTAGDQPPEVNFITESSHRPGWLWIASSQGLFLLEVSTGHIRRYLTDPKDPQSLSHGHVNCILEDRLGGMWVGAMYGLNQVIFRDGLATPAGFKHYTSADGLPNDRVYGILEDEQGYLWISTNKGVSRCHPAQMTFRNYTALDGLQSNEFNFGAFYRASDGEMFFGGINGISAFYPVKLVDSSYRPPVVFTSFQISNRPVVGNQRTSILDGEIAVATVVNLTHQDRVVSFEFASLDYTAPAKNTYACMMQGFDAHWVALGTNRRVTYTNLPPGAYTFLVRGSNSDGVWNPEPTSIRVLVAPPYWQASWFRFLMGLALVVALYSGHYFATRAMRRRNLELQHEIELRKNTEKALALAKEKYRSILERAMFGVFQVTPEGRFLSANPSMATILGYESPDQLLSITNLATEMYANPEDLQRMAQLLNTRKEVRDFQCQVRKRDGATAWALFNVRLVGEPETGDDYYEGMVQDITEQKKLAEQLAQAQRMESIGHLAGGVAHDFNNMLTVINGYVDLAQKGGREIPLEMCLKSIQVASDKAKKLTIQLLAFARRQVAQPVIVSPNALLQSMDPLLRQLMGDSVELRFDLAKDLWNIRMDPGQFEQILLNLAVNARDAMHLGGTLVIETRNLSIDEVQLPIREGAAAGPFVLITVSDTGVGIDKETLPHIFDPFFTTKAAEGGTGLGLATVYGVVTQNRGFITADSELGAGTAFKIYLPREEAQATPLPARSETTSPHGTEMILFVEDEEAVRDLAVSALGALGYTVLPAPNGIAALELVRANLLHIDLLVTDVVMPKMGGKQLATELLKTNRRLKVLYASGYSENVITHQGVLDSGVNFLQKPYTTRDLANRVRAVFDQT